MRDASSSPQNKRTIYSVEEIFEKECKNNPKVKKDLILIGSANKTLLGIYEVQLLSTLTDFNTVLLHELRKSYNLLVKNLTSNFMYTEYLRHNH